MAFTYASLFAGIGGFETALNRLGGRCVFASEIDKHARKAYEVLYGGDVLHGDITKIDAKNVPDHDLLTAGFPCQAFSVAGKRKGFDDTRGTLFFEIARIAKEKRPKALLLENVKGLVNHDKGRTLNTIVQTLCDTGYTVDFNVLNSKYFGVPQNRERIFIIAVRNDLIEPEPWTDVKGNTVVPKGKRRIQKLEGVRTFNFDWPPQTEVTTGLRDILEDNVDEKFYLGEEKTAKLVEQLRQNGRRIKQADDVMGALEVRSVHGIEYSRKSGVGKELDIAHTVNSSDWRGLNRNQKQNAVLEHPHCRIRRLTPRECWRLQGFTDAQHDAVEGAGVSNSQRYKQAGNAVTVNVVEALGAKLLSYLTKECEREAV